MGIKLDDMTSFFFLTLEAHGNKIFIHVPIQVGKIQIT